jgi:hypothetical protein
MGGISTFSLVIVLGVMLLAGGVNGETITSCGTVTEDSVMGNDLTTNGTCLTIGASNIVLDCAGHSITGSYFGRTSGKTQVLM